MSGELIYSKKVDRSLLKEGFTFPVTLVPSVLQFVGSVDLGSDKIITILLEDHPYKVSLRNINFNRTDYPTHKPIYQIRYSANGEFAQALQASFPCSYSYAKISIASGKKYDRIPTDLTEYLVLYTTDLPDVWQAECIRQEELIDFKKEIGDLSETEYEQILQNDTAAHIEIQQRLVKIRKLDSNVSKNLKSLYDYHCQICGCAVGELYGVNICEAHHLDPFTHSMNNDYDNIIILCPNHHRVMHACNPEFVRGTHARFIYPNGLVEKLKLNKHL